MKSPNAGTSGLGTFGYGGSKRTPSQPQSQCAGSLQPSFFVARADEPHRRLSGEFTTPAEAMRALAWLRRREPAARVVRRQTFYSFIEAM